MQAAADWGTYVAAHVYTPEGIRRALDAGVLSIEHARMADEASVRLIAELGAWLSTQTLGPGDNPLTPEQFAKAEPMIGVWEQTVGWAKTHGAKVAFGTDLLFQPDGTGKQNELLTRLAKVYSPLEVLKVAASGNCEPFARSGKRDPYKEAKLGVLQKGAWADMLLVDGDPTRDIGVLKDHERNFVAIVKAAKSTRTRSAREPAPDDTREDASMNRRHLIVGSTAPAAASVLACGPARGQAPGMASPARGMDPLWRWDAIDLAAAIAAWRVSSREATQSCLDRIAADAPPSGDGVPPGGGAVPAGGGPGAAG